MTENEKKQGLTNTKFVNTIVTKYQNECIRTNKFESDKGLIEYMMQHNVISEKEVNRYMVQDTYPEAMYECQNKKQQAVYWLEDRINLKERQIYTILQDCYKRFKRRAVDFL